MNKLLTIIVVFFGIFLGSFVIYAQTNDSATAPEIIYPVIELGNCKDKTECFAYCELPLNGKQCLAFAKTHQLLPEEEIRVAEKVLGVKGGPGGCNSKASCENYCDDVANIEACIAFAEENGLMKGRDLEEAKKVRAVIQSGKSLPGDCRNKNACENYCKNPEHMEECLAFAEASGFLPPEELAQAKIFMPLMKKGETPGACKSKEECDAYCESDEHFEECISFAEKHGMIPAEEREHIEAFKKAGGKGPGGCKGRQCQAFCEQPGNQQACLERAKANGDLKEDDLRLMEEGRQQIEKVLGDAPPEVASCLEGALGPGGVEKMRSGGFFGGEAMGEKMHACFEGFMSQMGGEFGGSNGEHGGPNGEPGRGGDFSGPGGCKGPDECMAYCKDHMEECQSFVPPASGGQGSFSGGGPGPGNMDECAKLNGDWNGTRCDFGQKECIKQGGTWDGKTCNFQFGQPDINGGKPSRGLPPGEYRGPGGCSTGEECKIYCETHPEECIGAKPPGDGPEYQTESQTQYYRGAEECIKQGGQWADGKCFFGSQYEIEKGEHIPSPLGESQQKFQQQYDQQYQQEFQKQYNQPTPNTSGDQNYQMTPEQQTQYQQQYQPVQ